MDADTIPWAYPELLSEDGLVEILKQRLLPPESLQNLDKEGLLQLYYQYVIPRPQRKYRNNRRGQLMSKKQIIRAKKRKILEVDMTVEPQIKKAAASSKFLSSFDLTSQPGSRIKPPPSCIDFQKKTIKLGSSSDPALAANSVSVNMKTDSETKTTVPETKKIIKLRPSSLGSESSSSFLNSIKIINRHLDSPRTNNIAETLKRTSISSSSEEKMQEENDEESKELVKRKQKAKETQASPRKKIKIKRISFP